MSIETTRKISRDDAIYRLRRINSMALDHNYRQVELSSFEPNEEVEYFVNNYQALSPSLDKYTNGMLEKLMDLPFFRFSNSENYRVLDTLEGEDQ